jgi:hypothetical protein
MRYSVLLIATFINSLVANAQAKDAEELVNKLEASGVLRKTGTNTLEFYISKPGDSSMLKNKYGGTLKNKNGTPYIINYVFDKPVKKTTDKTNDPTTSNKPAVVEQTISAIMPAPADGCFSRIKHFGYVNVSSSENRGIPYAIYNWTVPPGVTKLKIEGWSAGGNGKAKIYKRFKGGQDSMSHIMGGGGGGGAYVLSFIDVTPGDELRIRIPGGGSNGALTIDFPKSSKGFLNVTCGRNAEKEGVNNRGEMLFDGQAGRMENNTGVFAANTFSLRGQDGEAAELLSYMNSTNNVSMNTGPFGAPQPESIVDKFERYYGDGGDAPHSMHGGRGATVMQRVQINAKDGGTPGGGGGGGQPDQHPRSGRGAPGLLIIYY